MPKHLLRLPLHYTNPFVIQSTESEMAKHEQLAGLLKGKQTHQLNKYIL